MTVESEKKHWEKRRRDILSQAFSNLEKLLPSYDPSSAQTRLNVLLKSVEYIQEMQNKIQDLLKPNLKINAEVLQLKKLQERIKRLINRNELLSSLLREAKIPIPNRGATMKNFKHIHKWSGRINEKTALALMKKEEKTKETEKENKSLENTTPNTLKLQSKTKKKLNISGVIANQGKNVSKKPQIRKKLERLAPVKTANTNCVIIYTQACNSQPCYLLPSVTSSNHLTTSQTVVTNSILAANPVMSTNTNATAKVTSEQTPKLSTLSAGTLILANGALYPVVPQYQPLLSTPVVLQVTNNSNLTSAQLENTAKPSNGISSSSKLGNNKTLFPKKFSSGNNTKVIKLPNLLPATGAMSNQNIYFNKNFPSLKSCSTRTTHVNKVPIPSLASDSRSLIPELPETANMKKSISKSKRLGERRLGRKAFRNIRKMAKKREQEEKQEAAKRMKMDQTLPHEDRIEHSKTSVGAKSDEHASSKFVSSMETNNIQGHTICNEVIITNSSQKNGGLDILDTKIEKVNAEKSCISNTNSKIDLVVENTTQNLESDKNQREGHKDLVVDKSSMENLVPDKSNVNFEISVNEEILDNLPVPKNDSQENVECVNNKKNKTPDIIPSIHTNHLHQKEVLEEIHNSTGNDKDLKDVNEKLIEDSTNEVHNIGRSSNNIELDNMCNMNHTMKNLELQLNHSDLSNDIFASLQVPAGCQNPESTSPTAAFLLAFPLVSSLTGVKVTEVMDDDNPDSQRETPTLLQIGTMDTTKTTQSENFSSNLLNMDFFSPKDLYSGLYNSFEQHLNSITSSTNNFVNDMQKSLDKSTEITNNKVTDNLKDEITSNVQVPLLLKVESDRPNMIHKTGTSSNHTSTSKNVNSETENKGSNIQISQSKNVKICANELVCGGGVKSNTDDRAANGFSLNQLHNLNLKHKIVEDTQKHQEIFNVGNQSVQSNVDKKNDIKCLENKHQRQKSNTAHSSFDGFGLQGDISPQVSSGINIFQTSNQVAKIQVQHNPQSQNFGKQHTDMQSVFQHNMQTSQIPLGENHNFLTSSSQQNFVQNSLNIDNSISLCTQKDYKSSNYCSKDSHIPAPSKDIVGVTCMNQGNKNVNNSKNLQRDIGTSATLSKNGTYETLNVANKNALIKERTGDISLNFDFENKMVSSMLKPDGEMKDTSSVYSMTYANINYDLNTLTKVSTCGYNWNKTYTDPLYTNSNNTYNYYSTNETYSNENCYKSSRNDKNNHNSDFENYLDFRKVDMGNTYYSDNSKKNTVLPNKPESTQEKSTFNWITTSKNSLDSTVPFSKEETIYSNHNIINNNQATFFNTSSVYTSEMNSLGQISKKSFDLQLNSNYQKTDIEENQFNWSPTKIPQFLDPVPSFVSSTLPTLVGDLALGTSNFSEQKLEFTAAKSNTNNNKDSKNKSTLKFSYENQPNFFSVSQLVHQNDKVLPAKTTRRRSSGSGSKSNTSKNNKRIAKTNEEQKEIQQYFNKPPGSQTSGKSESKNLHFRQSNSAVFFDVHKRNLKVSSSNYSAEALIGPQGNSESTLKKDQVYTGGAMKNMAVAPYIPDNILPYFPPVDLQQDNYMQQNQNYQNFSHNFTTFPNNTYTTNNFIPSSTITTPYLGTGTFMSDLGHGHEFSSDNINIFSNSTISKDNNKLKTTTKSVTNRNEKEVQSSHCSNIMQKKMKRKSSHETNTTSLVDFSFLSVPGTISSPLLPDDFHSHPSFLPPPPPPPPSQPQLYPCKNSMYTSKQGNMSSSAPLLPLPPIPPVKSGIQYPEISPSLNSAGTSLTNFNLSTIFPEINKGSMNDIYTDNKLKEHSSTTKHQSNLSIPFNSKPIFTYPNCQTSQVYGVDGR